MVGRLSELAAERAAGRLQAEEAAQAFRVLSGPTGLNGIKGEDGDDGANVPYIWHGNIEDHHWVDSDSDSLEVAAAGLIPPRQLLMLMDYTRRLWLTADPKGSTPTHTATVSPTPTPTATATATATGPRDEILARLKWLKDVGNAITGTPQNQAIVSALQAETWAG